MRRGTVVVEASESYGRDFHLYVTGQTVSIIGDRIALIALVFLVVHVSHSSAPALGLFYVCRTVPTLFLGLLTGVLADHFDRRKLLLGCDLARALLLASTPALSAWNLNAIYPVVVVLYACNLLFDTASRAALPDVVSDSRLMGANAILSGIGNASDLAYGVGGVLIAAFQFQAPFFIDAGTFLFSAVMIYAMHIPVRDRGPWPNAREVLERVKSGMEFIGGNPFLKWSTVTFAIAPIAGGAGFVLGPLYAGSVLGHSAGLVGPLKTGAFRFSVLEVCLGMGALLGSLAASKLATRVPRGRLFGLGIAGTGLADALLGAVTNIYGAGVVMAISGLFSTLWIVASITLAQALTPTEVRGRVSAARTTVINTSLLIGSATAGLALLYVPIRLLWVLEGLVVAASSLFVWLRSDVREQR